MKMNKFVTVCLIAAAAGLVIGGIGLLCGGRVYGLSFGRNGVAVNSNHNGSVSQEYQYIRENKDLEAFRSLEVDIDFADIEIRESDHFGIEYCIRENCDLIQKMQGDTMTITQKKPIGTSEFNFFSVGSVTIKGLSENEHVKIYVPKGENFDTISIKNDSGDITLDDLIAEKLTIQDSFGNITAKKLNVKEAGIQVESGDITINEVEAEQFTVEDSFGMVNVRNAVVVERIVASVESGDIEFENMDANDIQLDTSFGNIEGGTLTADTLALEVESGDCEIKDLSGGTAEVNLQFGNVDMGLRETVDAYSVKVNSEFGAIEVNGEDMGTKYKNIAQDGKYNMKLSVESGDIRLYDAGK